ncbi:MAG TPA: universal stress protein [Steroidobacteraceae bacterium]|nr:universal stress protein [Steroidobacteraceae bacterium]
MTRSIRSILVAVKDPRRRASPAVRKAARLAHALGARVELFHAISEPVPVDALIYTRENVGAYEAREQARCLKRLEGLAAPLRKSGLTVAVTAEWDFPAHQAVVRRARRMGADLIVAERHASRHVAPWMLRYNDWELLRHSPVPVLLVKTRRAYGRIKALAAVDPSHAFAKTASLDDAILHVAAEVSSATRGQLHAVHAYVPSLVDIAPGELTAPDAPARIIGHAASLAAARFTKALRAARLATLPRARRHLLAQHPVDAIAGLARTLRPDIIVMGLARSGIKGLLIGNTAEQLLDELPCDLLIVKPPGFPMQVPAKARGPYLISLAPPYGMA